MCAVDVRIARERELALDATMPFSKLGLDPEHFEAMRFDGSERMTEIVTALSANDRILADLVVRLASATADEIPALREEAEMLAQHVVDCCMDAAPVDHLPHEEVAALQSELVKLADALKAQIAGVVNLCLAHTMGGATSHTRH
jgi:hypothetical protein